MGGESTVLGMSVMSSTVERLRTSREAAKTGD